MYTILVADDERWIRKGIVKMIDCEKNQISEIFEAVTVQEAMEIYDQKKPDIVLTDICFPTKSGCDLIEYIYSDNPNVCVVLISAYSDFSYAQHALRFHASNYLLKPVSKEKLNQAIKECREELRALEERAMHKKQVLGSTTEVLPNSWREKADLNPSEIIVNKVIEELDRDCAQKISLPQLAETYHISEAYLSHVFKKQTGKSLMNYIAQIRIEKASQLIAMSSNGSSGKFYVVAQQVGYEDYSYFVRVFKKVMGMSPREFHKKIMQERGEYVEED
ncbi:MAG: response regulator [Lachnospiraceae bacterium]|nr:response regulator [Lachnospiraceae bacterium]